MDRAASRRRDLTTHRAHHQGTAAMNLRTAALTLLFVTGAAGAEAPAKVAADSYGLSKEQAVEVCKPRGEHEYLARLVCPDSEHATFERSGNFGERTPLPDDLSDDATNRLIEDMMGYKALQPGEADYHIVDGYEVACGETKIRVYLDMYHCDAPRPTRAPAGFSIIN
ncbi:putative integron gene cassette protein [Lysobacter capsici]|nr:putative integron gene cassette protein [Lysobacter capsici]